MLSFILDELGRSSDSPITLNCPTTGLPPYLVTWRKSGDLLVSGGSYEISTVLRDRKNTTFDHFLRIYQTPQQAQGIYRCWSGNALEGPVQNRSAGATISSGMYRYIIIIVILITLFDHYYHYNYKDFVTYYFICLIHVYIIILILYNFLQLIHKQSIATFQCTLWVICGQLHAHFEVYHPRATRGLMKRETL